MTRADWALTSYASLAGIVMMLTGYLGKLPPVLRCGQVVAIGACAASIIGNAPQGRWGSVVFAALAVVCLAAAFVVSLRRQRHG